MIDKKSLKISDTEYYDNSIERIANEANNSNEYATKRLSPRELKQRFMLPVKMLREHFDALIDLLDGLDVDGKITAESILGLIHTGIPSLPTLYDLVKAFPEGKLPDAIFFEDGKTLRTLNEDFSKIQAWISAFESALGITINEGGKETLYRLVESGELSALLDMLGAYQKGEIKGGSSVWIGPNPPPDDSYDVWIDTDDNSGGAPVQSVNGKTGLVELTAEDVDADHAGTANKAVDAHNSSDEAHPDIRKQLDGLGRPPTKVSDLENDAGYLTQESDPTVPAWAKQPNKPSYTASDVGADPAGTASGAVATHNTATTAHNDIRLLIEGLAARLNALANSTDEDLDQMAEIVAYIKSNKSLIDSITTSKVNVTDIINNLTTNVSTKPLSAAQGVALKALIDSLSTAKLDADKLSEAVDAALAEAKASGAFDGKDGTSATHYWSGTTLTVTSASGTSSADLKGEKGDPGVYVGSGEMPEDCNIQIDPEGDAITIDSIVSAVIAALPVYDGSVMGV